ncbi:hypothetical protein I4U23_026898 [Adineta vaga]|nr:hypothetical protein I4U23_026898 [Adineta vaga]
MIKTSRVMTDYSTKPNERFYGNKNQSNNYPYVITNRSKHGLYNVTERDYGDQKVSYYIPAEYEHNYDPSYLDDKPIYDEQERYNTPVLVRRRYYRSLDNNQPYYNEELPMIRSHQYVPPPPKQPRVIKRVYFRPSPTPSPPPEVVEYTYEDDHTPDKQEYIVPKQKYVEQPKPVPRQVYQESHSPPPPPPPRQPVKPLRLDELPTARQSKPYRPSPRESSNRSLPQLNRKPKPHLSLQEVLAQNRARRGSRIPIPRREIDEEQIYDLPTYRRNYVKNGFIVHK